MVNLFIIVCVSAHIFYCCLVSVGMGAFEKYIYRFRFHDFMYTICVFTNKLCFIFYKQVAISVIRFLLWINAFLSIIIDFQSQCIDRYKINCTGRRKVCWWLEIYYMDCSRNNVRIIVTLFLWPSLLWPITNNYCKTCLVNASIHSQISLHIHTVWSEYLLWSEYSPCA